MAAAKASAKKNVHQLGLPRLAVRRLFELFREYDSHQPNAFDEEVAFFGRPGNHGFMVTERLATAEPAPRGEFGSLSLSALACKKIHARLPQYMKEALSAEFSIPDVYPLGLFADLSGRFYKRESKDGYRFWSCIVKDNKSMHFPQMGDRLTLSNKSLSEPITLRVIGGKFDFPARMVTMWIETERLEMPF